VSIAARNIAVPFGAPPTRAWDRGFGNQLPTVNTQGGGPLYWSRGVNPAAVARGIGAMGDPMDVLGVFEGCTNRARVASYMTALRVESTMQGAIAGAIAGGVLATLGILYLKAAK
jgi:hypothetical protein